MAIMEDDEIAQILIDYGKFKEQVKPVLDKVDNHEKRLNEIQLTMAEEPARIRAVAVAAVEEVMSRKGRRLERWTPIIVALIGSGGIGGIIFFSIVDMFSKYMQQILSLTSATP